MLQEKTKEEGDGAGVRVLRVAGISDAKTRVLAVGGYQREKSLKYNWLYE